MSRYAVIDLEMCEVGKEARTPRFPYKKEIIQIGAVLLDESFEITDRFATLVSPQFGAVNSFIQNLTGISRKDTESAPALNEALELFAAWLPENTVFVAWSENDECQLRRETDAKEIHIPAIEKALDGCVDCQRLFGERMKSPKVYKLSEALSIADIDYEEGAHDALVDAVNTAFLFSKLNTEDELSLSKYYNKDEGENHLMYHPFAALFDFSSTR